MAPLIRPMEERDIPEASRLMERVFPKSDCPEHEWNDLFQWLYFSPRLENSVPRAFVVSDGHAIIGHVGLTLSEWCYGRDRITVANTLNWVIDRHAKGLGVRLMLRAISKTGITTTIGGTLDTRRILPGLGFAEQLAVGSYVKVLRPWGFLRMCQSATELGKGIAKVGLSSGSSALTYISEARRKCHYEIVEDEDLSVSREADERATRFQRTSSVVRNALDSRFLAWYRQCPRGHVRVFHCMRQGTAVGRAIVLVRASAKGCFANILSVDLWIDDRAAWVDFLDGIEEILQRLNVSHINTLATYERWCRALECRHYLKRRPVPLWLRGTHPALASAKDWHITAIEGDVGYLLE